MHGYSHCMYYRSALNAMRTAQEERRTLTRTSTLHSINKSIITDAELDEDGDIPFPEDKPGLKAVLHFPN